MCYAEMCLKRPIPMACGGCPPVIAGLWRTELPLPLCNPCSFLIPPAGRLWSSAPAPCRQRGGLSESTVRSWRRSLPSLGFIAVSPGLFLQLAGQSDLWLPLLVPVGSFPTSPHRILLLLRSFKGLLCQQSRRV